MHLLFGHEFSADFVDVGPVDTNLAQYLNHTRVVRLSCQAILTFVVLVGRGICHRTGELAARESSEGECRGVMKVIEYIKRRSSAL